MNKDAPSPERMEQVDVPEGWRWVCLGDYLTEAGRKNRDNAALPVYSVTNERGFVPSDEFFRKRVYSQALSTYKIVRRNQFAYNPYRINVGSIALLEPDAPPEVLVSPAYVVFGVSPEILSEFLFYLLKSPQFSSEIMRVSMSRGSVRRILAFTDLCGFRIPLPPLHEQQAIAAALRAVQRSKEATEKVVVAMRQFKASLMNHLFTYGPVPVDQADQVPLQETEVGLIPGDWSVVPFAQVASLQGGLAFRSHDTVPSSRTQLVRMGNLYQNKLDLSRNPVFYPDDFSARYPDDVLKKGDLVISLTGTMGKEDYGFTVKLPETPYVLLLNQRVARVHPREESVDRNFLLHFLHTRRFLDKLYKTAKGTKQANLSMYTILRLPVIMPPLSEQRQIVAQLASLDAKVAAEVARRAALDNLFRSMLHHLMAGKVRVGHLPE